MTPVSSLQRASAAHTASLVVGELADGDAARWDRYVDSAAGASLYHEHAWRSVVREVFGHDTIYLVAEERGNGIVGVLPLVRLNSRLFGDFLVSLPFFNRGGVVAESPGAAQELIAAATERARDLGVAHMELRHVADVCPEWPQRVDKVAMVLALPESAEALHQQLPSKLRSQIKRPLREGAACVSGGRELLDDFYLVFARNMRDLGTPVYPKRFFAAILDRFARARLLVVRLANVPVAAGMVIGHRDTLEIPWASSLRSANAIGVNMLLYWEALSYACGQGYRWFDFGRSTPDSGTYRFKRQWGAQPLQLYWHYWMRDRKEPPRLNPSNPRYRLAVAAWQRLPLPIANALGPLIVRNLP
ncbi:MAG TPA: FemAB family XrtA/PEP-CTERM system-associated protein [Steroidobacteraceae bacterium]